MNVESKKELDNLVFLDTETTGVGPEDRLCQCAYIYQEKEYNELFKPPLDISIEAQSISHVTNRHVADKPVFEGSDMQKHLQDTFSDKESIIVAHNAKFDIEMLARDGVVTNKFIDTYKVAMALDPEGVIPRYSMQYLRYFLDLQVEGAQAHDALGDVLVLKALFIRLYNKCLEKDMDHDQALVWMSEVSTQPTFVHTFIFGKYKGKKTTEVAQKDRGYLQWLQGQKEQQVASGEIAEDDDWIFTLNKLLS